MYTKINNYAILFVVKKLKRGSIMGEIIYIILLILTIVLFKFIFKINLKKAKALSQNKELEKITDKFPENVEVANEVVEA